MDQYTVKRDRINYTPLEKNLLQKLYNDYKRDLIGGDKNLKKNVIEIIANRFNGNGEIKAKRSFDQIKGQISAIQKNSTTPQRIYARRNTTCGEGTSHRRQSRPTSRDTEIEREQPKASSSNKENSSDSLNFNKDTYVQNKYELLQMQLKNEKTREKILEKKLEKLVRELGG